MSMATAIDNEVTWQPLCRKADLVEYSGVAAWLETPDGPVQVALFFLPDPNISEPAPTTAELLAAATVAESSSRVSEIYAVDNRDPFSGANVIARGIVGDLKGEPVVASPLYKQHFRLGDGVCLEDAEMRLRCWPVRLDGERVLVAVG